MGVPAGIEPNDWWTPDLPCSECGLLFWIDDLEYGLCVDCHKKGADSWETEKIES